MSGEATLRAGWTPPSSTTTSRPSSSRSGRRSGETRRGSSSIDDRRAPSSIGRSPSSLSSSRTASSSSTTRRSCRRASSYAGRRAVRSRCCWSRASAGGVGRPSRGRRGAFAQASAWGASCSSKRWVEGRWVVRARGRAGRRRTASAVHPRATRRRRALPDRLRRRERVRRRADCRAPLHARAGRAPRSRARHAARRARHVPSGRGGGAGGARDSRRALRGEPQGLGADLVRSARARGRGRRRCE